MARDRKRARQRRPRRRPEGAPAQAQSRVVRADLPGQLDHVGDVDEFDAALIRGAGGVPVESEPSVEPDRDRGGRQVEAPPARERPSRGPSGNGSAAQEAFGAQVAVPARLPRQPVGSRVAAFLRASWAELQRVQWPDRRQVSQATAVVLGFVAVMGAYLGAADWAAQKIVNFIL